MTIFPTRLVSTSESGGFKITVFPFGICRVVTLGNHDDWANGLLVTLFKWSKHKWPFLKRHIRGEWWICDTALLKFPRDNKVWAIKAQWIGFDDLGNRHYTKAAIWRSVEDFDQNNKNRLEKARIEDDRRCQREHGMSRVEWDEKKYKEWLESVSKVEKPQRERLIG